MPSLREPYVFEAEPKAVRFLLIPTGFMGLVPLVIGLASMFRGLDSVWLWLWAGGLMLVGGALVLVSLWVITLRSRVYVDRETGDIEVVRSSLLGKNRTPYEAGSFDKVELRVMKRSAHADQPNPIPEYTMIWLVGPNVSVHVASEADADVAREAAGELAGVLGIIVEVPEVV